MLKLLGSLYRGTRATLLLVFGRISWQPPPWLGSVRRASMRLGLWAQRHPALALVGLMLMVSGLLGGYHLHRWLRHRPVPSTIAVSITAPAARDVAAKHPPRPLVLRFGASVAPLGNVGARVSRGVELSPGIAGRWRWDGDKRLVFRPSRPWPVGQRLRVTLAREGLLAPGKRLARCTLETSTPALRVTLERTRFYVDPRSPKVRRVVATLSFSHPVDPSTVPSRVGLALTPRGREPRPLRTTLRYDKLRLHAYVQSEPLSIPPRDTPARLSVTPGLRASAGGNPSFARLAGQVTVPGIYSHLRVASARSVVVDRPGKAPQRVLLVATSDAVEPARLAAKLRVHLLPRQHPDQAKDAARAATGANRRPYRWHDVALIGSDIVRAGKRLKLLRVEAGADGKHTLFAFRYRAPVGRWLHVRVERDLGAKSGYRLGKTFTATLQVPAVPQRLKILSKGVLLRLSGQRRLAVYARNVPGISLTVRRVLPRQLHHFVALSYGPMASAHLSSLPLSSLSEAFSAKRRIAPPARCRPPKGSSRIEGTRRGGADAAATGCAHGTTVSFDLGRYLRRGAGSPRGVFVVDVRAYRDSALERLGAVRDRRLVLLTDLGLIVKLSRSGARDLFVQSLTSGAPVAGARVALVGRNGVTLAATRSDARGHARLGQPNARERAGAPTMWVVRRGGDLAYLPHRSWRRKLDLSRFDTGGLSGRADPRAVRAFVFSDRGIYRPGETIRVAALVKRNDFGGGLASLPLELDVRDPRGLVVRRVTARAGAGGFVELAHPTARTARTGGYRVTVHLVRPTRAGASGNAARRTLLGSTTVRVREFHADRLKIRARILPRASGAWLRPRAVKAVVRLRTLYGTPAANRRVRGRLTLSPAYGLRFGGKLAGFRFSDALQTRRSFSEQLGETRTDAKGVATFALDLTRFAPGTYRVRFVAEGFEASGGHSVVAAARAVVSPLTTLVGYKTAGGSLSSIPHGSKRRLVLVAVGRDGQATALGGLTLTRVERRFVTVLTRQGDGTYAYQSLRRERVVSRRALGLRAGETKLALDTSKPGDFRLELRDKRGRKLVALTYSVAGERNVARSLERSAKLELSLAKGDVRAGKLLRVEIKGPYAGAGLITIERDRVETFRWFRARKGTTVQQIRVPRRLEGNAYVSVTLLRSARSNKVFTSPLSYAVAPLTISRARRTLRVDLEVPKKVRPGRDLVVRYKTSAPARLLLFAVDEGILRVARYRTPDALSFFFKKRALAVQTWQTLDLVLPEARQLLAAPGGGGDYDGARSASRANLNPFRRRRVAPVAFWSGVVRSARRAGQWRVKLPDHFDGSVRVMAVATSPSAVSAATSTRAVVRGAIVLSPSAPLAVTPGDTFELGVNVSYPKLRGVRGKRATARELHPVTVRLSPSAHLEIVGKASQSLSLRRGDDGVLRFTVRALSRLGAATVNIAASSGAHARAARVELSVRPATPRVTTVIAGVVRDSSTRVPLPRRLYAAYRRQRAGISALPLGLAPALVGYLRGFPHGCTEQIVSQTWPALVLRGQPHVGFARGKARRAVAHAIARLAGRQSSEGAFGLWAANPTISPFATVYTLHFLVEARERGVAVPRAMLTRGLRWARALLSRPSPGGLADDRLRAYAAYVLARSGRVVGGETAAIHRRLERRHPEAFRRDLAAAYLAATYKLLKQDDLAEALIRRAVDFGRTRRADYQRFYDSLIHDAQLLYVLSRHFPKHAAAVSRRGIDALVVALRSGRFNTLSAAYTILALDAYSRAARAALAKGDAGLQVLAERADGATAALALPARVRGRRALLPMAAFGADTRALRFSAKGRFEGYYSVLQSGYDRAPPRAALRAGLEVHRQYVDARGKPLGGRPLRVGTELFARVRLRAVDGKRHPRVAVVDLLPGALALVQGGAVPSKARTRGVPRLPLHNSDAREDRLVLYAAADASAREHVYRLKVVAVGRFAVPPAKAESLYDRSVVGRSLGGTLVAVHGKSAK